VQDTRIAAIRRKDSRKNGFFMVYFLFMKKKGKSTNYCQMMAAAFPEMKQKFPNLLKNKE
jgi:hypothetical protein